MRTKVIKLLDCSSKDGQSKAMKPSHDITFLNELIREYLDWMGYKYSSTVFIAGIYIYIYDFLKLFYRISLLLWKNLLRILLYKLKIFIHHCIHNSIVHMTAYFE